MEDIKIEKKAWKKPELTKLLSLKDTGNPGGGRGSHGGPDHPACSQPNPPWWCNGAS